MVPYDLFIQINGEEIYSKFTKLLIIPTRIENGLKYPEEELYNNDSQ